MRRRGPAMVSHLWTAHRLPNALVDRDCGRRAQTEQKLMPAQRYRPTRPEPLPKRLPSTTSATHAPRRPPQHPLRRPPNA